MIELTPYEQFQLEKYGNVLPPVEVMPDGTCENGEEELRRDEEWFFRQSEQEFLNSEN